MHPGHCWSAARVWFASFCVRGLPREARHPAHRCHVFADWATLVFHRVDPPPPPASLLSQTKESQGLNLTTRVVWPNCASTQAKQLRPQARATSQA